MYVGRIVCIGRTNGSPFVAYRVSSRSFPNRSAKAHEDAVEIVPKKGFEGDLKKNPYISYNAIKKQGKYVVVSNGAHTDLIEKNLVEHEPKDALGFALLMMGHEKDSMDTPRIAGIIDTEKNVGWLGIIRKDYVCAEEFELQENSIFYIATYELNKIEKNNVVLINEKDADSIAKFVVDGEFFSTLENPVCSAAWCAGKFAVLNK